jgi:hypothetical protein
MIALDCGNNQEQSYLDTAMFAGHFRAGCFQPDRKCFQLWVPTPKINRESQQLSSMKME